MKMMKMICISAWNSKHCLTTSTLSRKISFIHYIVFNFIFCPFALAVFSLSFSWWDHTLSPVVKPPTHRITAQWNIKAAPSTQQESHSASLLISYINVSFLRQPPHTNCTAVHQGLNTWRLRTSLLHPVGFTNLIMYICNKYIYMAEFGLE